MRGMQGHIQLIAYQMAQFGQVIELFDLIDQSVEDLLLIVLFTKETLVEPVLKPLTEVEAERNQNYQEDRQRLMHEERFNCLIRFRKYSIQEHENRRQQHHAQHVTRQ